MSTTQQHPALSWGLITYVDDRCAEASYETFLEAVAARDAHQKVLIAAWEKAVETSLQADFAWTFANLPWEEDEESPEARACAEAKAAVQEAWVNLDAFFNEPVPWGVCDDHVFDDQVDP